MRKRVSLGVLTLMLILVLSACGSYDALLSNASFYYNHSYDIALSEGTLDYDFSEIGGGVDFVSLQGDLDDYQTSPTPPVVLRSEASFMYMTFEEAITEFATDVVVAQYVGSRPFGVNLTEFEFIVVDRILGYAGDRIFVYSNNNVSADVFGASESVVYMPGNLAFSYGTTYMLPLIRISRAHTNIQAEGFTFIRNIVINLDNPAMSIMYSEELSNHSAALDFSAMGHARMDVASFLVSYVDKLTRYNTPSRGFINSNEIEDILYESPYVLLIEIGSPLRLSHEQASTDLMATDLFYINIIYELKGNPVITYDTVMIFVANTVSPGEQHIVAVEPITEGSSWFQLTSRNSLFSFDQLLTIEPILTAQQ